VVNPDPSRGQLSSLQTALAQVPNEAEGFLFMPVDCPAVEGETVGRIVDAFRSSGALLVVPRFEGRNGHPVCVRSELIGEFLTENGSAKDVVRRHVDRTFYMDTSDAGVLSDIDDPEAYRVLKMGRSGTCPTS
jgi:molybdenum cofactor cytidylyltransferase